MNILLKALEQQQWLLYDFVNIINQLLPEFLPITKGNERVKEEVNPRLVRYYTTTELIDPPGRDGKNAVYNYRHLLQLLVVRKLLAQGINANAIGKLTTTSNNCELEKLLAGPVQISPSSTNNPALEYLQKLPEKRQTISEQAVIKIPNITDNLSSQITHWIKIEIQTGLEIHISSDFDYPHNSYEQQQLINHLTQKVKQFIYTQTNQNL